MIAKAQKKKNRKLSDPNIKRKKKRTKKGDIKKKKKIEKTERTQVRNVGDKNFRVIMIMTGMTKTYKKVKEKKQTIRGEIVI